MGLSLTGASDLPCYTPFSLCLLVSVGSSKQASGKGLLKFPPRLPKVADEGNRSIGKRCEIIVQGCICISGVTVNSLLGFR
jgi:hypothetical protein